MANLTDIKEFGNLKIARDMDCKSDKSAYCITDDWLTDWIIFYGDIFDDKSKPRWAHDGIFKVSDNMRKFLNKMALDI